MKIGYGRIFVDLSEMTNFTKVGLKLKPDFNKLIYFFSKTKKLKFAIRSANILMSCYSPILQLYQPKNYLVRKVYKLADLSKMSICGIKCGRIHYYAPGGDIYIQGISLALIELYPILASHLFLDSSVLITSSINPHKLLTNSHPTMQNKRIY